MYLLTMQIISFTRQVDTLEILKQQEDDFPIINRLNELESLEEELIAFSGTAGRTKNNHIIAVKGDTGSGKSRLLDAMIVRCALSHVR